MTVSCIILPAFSATSEKDSGDGYMHLGLRLLCLKESTSICLFLFGQFFRHSVCIALFKGSQPFLWRAMAGGIVASYRPIELEQCCLAAFLVCLTHDDSVVVVLDCIDTCFLQL